MQQPNKIEKSDNNPLGGIHFIERLRKVLKLHKDESITFGEIMKSLKEEGLIFLIAIVALPTAIPVPTPPGFTTLFGIPLCFLTVQMLYKIDSPWLPDWLSNRKIKVVTLGHFVDKAEMIFEKMAKFLRPRYSRFTTRNIERLVGILSFLCSVSIALPILFGNAIPSMAILIMALGLLYKDGLVVVIGMITSIIGLIIAVGVIVVISFLGLEVLHRIIDSELLHKLPF